MVAPIAAAIVAGTIVSLPSPSLLQGLATFGVLKLAADILRGRAWPSPDRYADDIARDWLAWALVAGVYTLAAFASDRFARPAPGPMWPALIAYFILWVP